MQNLICCFLSFFGAVLGGILGVVGALIVAYKQDRKKENEARLILLFNLLKFLNYANNTLASEIISYEQYPSLSSLFEQSMFVVPIDEKNRIVLNDFYEKYLKIKERLLFKSYKPSEGLIGSVVFHPKEFLEDLKKMKEYVLCLQNYL